MLVAVGSYSEPAGHVKGELGVGISTLKCEADFLGRFELKPTKWLRENGALPLRNPTSLVKHPTKQILYAVQETDAYEDAASFPGEASSVVTISFDGTTGALNVLDKRPFEGAVACNIDTDGEFLVIACYMGKEARGILQIFTLDAEGSITELAKTVHFDHASKAAGDAARNGVDAGRQESSHPHMALITKKADGSKVVLVPDLGGDLVHCIGLPSFEMLPKAELAVGSGPRHCCVRAGMVYVVSEMTSTVDVLELETMKSVQRISTLPATVDLSHNKFFQDVVKQSETAAIKLSADGKMLYVSNRGHDSIALFSIADNGHLEVVSHAFTGGKTPRDFFVHPNGKAVFPMNQDSGTILTFCVMDGGKFDPTMFECKIPSPVTMIALTE